MTNLDSVLKSRDITLLTKVHIIKAMVFPIVSVHWKVWCWCWNSNTLATGCEGLIHLKRLWSWERLRAGGEGDNRDWDDWVASLTHWTWVWVNSGSWWWTGRPGVLHTMGWQSRTRLSDWTELHWLGGGFQYWLVYQSGFKQNIKRG